MREILFRGKRIDRLGKGKWIEGGVVHQTDFYGDVIDTYRIIDGTDTEDNDIGFSYKVDPSTVGQYTGLTDKNGKKIFEGDICRYNTVVGTTVMKIIYKNGGFTAVNSSHLVRMVDLRKEFWNKYMEVIGNIHDNPELLEDGE